MQAHPGESGSGQARAPLIAPVHPHEKATFLQCRLKRERVSRVRYRTREDARPDGFDYTERFYNRQRSHGNLGYTSAARYERQAMRTLPGGPKYQGKTQWLKADC